MKSRKLSSAPAITGQCLCGAVQFEMECLAFWAWHDHSRASRLAHGAVYATYVGAWRKRFRTTAGELEISRFEEKQTGAVRSFCRRCGTPLVYERTRSRHMINIPRALFQSRTGRQPIYHIAIEEMQDWAYAGEPLVPLKGYVRTKPPVRPKLDPFIAIMDKIMADDKGRPKKQQHTSKRIFERLRDKHGFTGGITIVKDYVAGWRQRAREMFVPLMHPPGHAQADFGEAIAVIRVMQTKQGAAYSNITINANQFGLGDPAAGSNISIFPSGIDDQPYLCNIVITNNVINNMITRAVPFISVSEGDGAIIKNNVINGTGHVGPVGIQTDYHVKNGIVGSNVGVDLPSGIYGTLGPGTVRED
jgi:hypothetical protein